MENQTKNQIFIKSDVMNYIFYDKEKFVSKNILENFPDETISYDENDKIIIAKLDDDADLLKKKFMFMVKYQKY